MSDDAKRLDKIREGSYFQEKLTYSDLLMLLEHDPAVQRLIQQLAAQPTSEVSPPSEAPDSLEQAPLPEEEVEMLSFEDDEELFSMSVFEPEPAPAVDPLRTELQPALDLLALFEADNSLKESWIRTEDTEGQRLLRLVATWGDWQQLEYLWDQLAQRLKQDGRAATDNEHAILTGCLDCYNLTTRQLSACLITPEPSVLYNHKEHNRLNSKGKHITQLALPGLLNAAGNITRKPLVITE